MLIFSINHSIIVCRMKYTIREISEITNVAVSTVSKALNGQKGVSEKKRQEILRIAEKVHYQPNANARALAHRKTSTIGLIVPGDADYSLSGVYWSVLIAAIAKEANSQKYNLMLICPDLQRPDQTISEIIQKQAVDGLIIPSELVTKKDVKALMEAGLPFVMQGCSPVAEHCCVDVKNKDGARKLTAALIARGYKRIGCVAGDRKLLYTQERVEGFMEEMKNAGFASDAILYTSYSKEETQENIRTFTEAFPDLDALFISAGGEFPFYIIDVLKEKNYDLHAFGLAVFGDYTPYHYLPYRIITASQPVRKMGIQDTKNLLQLINKETPPSLSLFDTEIQS